MWSLLLRLALCSALAGAQTDEASLQVKRATDCDGCCKYPPNIQNGKYSVVGCDSCTPVPGEFVEDEVEALKFICDPGFQLSGQDVLSCIDGKWNNDPPACVDGKCPALSSSSRYAVCSVNQTQFSCDWSVPPGTTAVVSCKAFYASAGAESQKLTCGSNGQWSDAVIKCSPECGKDTTRSKALIAYGDVVKHGSFPWHVGIYKKIDNAYLQICGGSLISNSYILTAAHCFWDNSRNEAHPTDLFKILAGKFHRSYTEKDDWQQEQPVEKIEIPPGFSGLSTSYRHNIAVVTVRHPFEFSEGVRPVCVDWDNNYYLTPGDKGQVAGWGITETGEPSEDLRTAEFPVIEFQQCLQETKPNYRRYLGSDKICGGYRNGTTACSGDSGGGLTSTHDIGHSGAPNKAYFIHGIVSNVLGASTISCNFEDYVAFTKVSSFGDLLKKYREY